jgi:tetrapyrrole methylase family protein/MazG family protein
MEYTKYLPVMEKIEGVKDIHQIKLVDGKMLEGMHILLHAPDETALYMIDDVSPCIPLLKTKAASIYTDHKVSLFERSGSEWVKRDVLGKDLGEFIQGKHEVFIYFPPITPNSSMIAFQELVAHLRAPEGCPWDREQTHASLKGNLLEETYEVLEAIDEDNPDSLMEELGDLLLQIVLHSQISSEIDEFDLSQVLHAIHAKITFRHPHVFKDVKVNGAKDVIHNWEVLKSQERENNHSTRESILDSIPRNLPALALAQKYQDRAARVGFDWKEITPVFEKIDEELQELKAAGKDSLEDELGDLLFAVVNLVRWYGFDSESCLKKMTRRFYQRFASIEKAASSAGRKLNDLTLEEMDALWELAKRNEPKAAQNGQ